MSKSKDTQTNNTQPKSGNKKSKGYQKAIEFAIILLFFGVVAILLSVLFLSKEMANKPELAPINTYCLYGGIGVTALAVLILIIGISVGVKAKKKQKKAQSQPKPEVMTDVEVSLDAPTTTSGGTTVTYVPSQEAPTFIEMGSYQTIEEKFDQIAKMDKTVNI